MKKLGTVDDAVKSGMRRMVVSGSPGTGKTTFSLSASAYAGDIIGAAPVECKDVVLLQGDCDGVQGGIDAGLRPGLIADFTVCEKWPEYNKMLTEIIQDLKPMVDKGDVKYVVVDLSLPAKLLIDHLKPADQQGWGRVAAESMTFYKMFGFLKTATVIGNAQLRSAQAPTETSVAAAAADAKAVGGERSTLSADLVKSFYAHWSENASFIVAREAKKKRNPMKPQEPPVTERFSHMHSSSRFETKCRFQTKVLATEPGDRTFNSILRACYGDLL